MAEGTRESRLAAIAARWIAEAKSLRDCSGPEADAPKNVSGEYQRARDLEECAADILALPE